MMTQKSRFTALLAAILFATVLSTGQAYAQKGDTILDRLRARYESTDALRAHFVQTIGDASMEGTLTLRGDAYRIETGDQTLVTDGTTAWVYSKSEKQVLVNDAVADETAFSPADFFTNYPDRFNVTVQGSESISGVRHDRLKLTPKESGSFLREVTLFVRASDALPTRVQIVDGNGTRVAFDLRDVEVNPRLGNDVFRFVTPQGAEVVDLRS
ncbi:MAG: outer membrane lipoprotein carrier protein LolA [Rhodothermales bacterium]